ncbi:hypothetical protein [Duganella margarita]|uniref:hypothetical protein n=1 Tax=Duganella margarita TaxID=2692170 RepID=UPI001E5F95FD|nr:hypothetical protein [Duganella margarita]
MKKRLTIPTEARKEHVSANHVQSGTPAMQLTATMLDARAPSPAMLQLQQSASNSSGSVKLKQLAGWMSGNGPDAPVQREEKPSQLQAHACAQGSQIHVAPDQERHVAQRMLFAPPNTGDVVQWNAILQHVQNLHALHVLPNMAAINNYIPQAEAEWEGDDEHTAPINQFNAVVTLKYRIKEGLTALRRNPLDAHNLNWGNIIGYLTGVNTAGFITVVTQINVALPGGHGNGDLWTASDGTTGTVPYAAHGRGPGALNGARGAVHTVILAHNVAVEAAKTAVDNL